MQTGGVKCGGLLGQQNAIGCESDVANARHFDSMSTSFGKSCRTSGSPPVSRSLSIPRGRHHMHKPDNFLKREQLVPRPELHMSRPACNRSSGYCSDR